MTPMLEKIARAICLADGHDPDGPVCDIYIHDDPDAGKPWAEYRSQARAALLAMREPDRVVVDEIASRLGDGVSPYEPNPNVFFTAMIDAILKGSGE